MVKNTIKNHTPPHKRGYDYRVHEKLGVRQRYTSRNYPEFAVSQVQKKQESIEI